MSVITMECNIPKNFIRSQSGTKNTSLDSYLDLLIPLARKKIPGHSLITNKIEERFPGYLREIYWHTVRVHTNEALFQDIMDAMIEKLKEEG